MKTYQKQTPQGLRAGIIALAVIFSAALFAACESPINVVTPPPAKYALTVPPAENGNSVTVAGGATEFEADATVTLDVTVAEGYMIDSLTLSAGTLTPAFTHGGRQYAFQMPAQAVTVSASFSAVQKYGITVVIDDSRGEAVGGTATTDPADEAYEGNPVIVRTVPNDASYTLSVIVKTDSDGIVIAHQIGDTDDYEFDMPDEGVTVTVVFEDKSKVPFNIAIGEAAGGTIDVAENKGVAGDTISVVLTPDALHKLDGATVSVSGATATITASRDGATSVWTFTMPEEDVTVSAVFAARARYDLSLPPTVVGGNIAFIANPAATAEGVPEGAAVTLTLTVSDTDNKQYKAGDLTATCADASFSIGSVDDSGQPSVYAWTFAMPEAAVTIAVTLSDRPAYEYAIATAVLDADGQAAGAGLIASANAVWTVSRAVAGNDSHALTGSIRENWPVVLTLTFNTTSFSLIPAAEDKGIAINAGDDDVPYTTAQGSYVYHFNMPAADITISATLKAIDSGETLVYSNGAILMPGVTLLEKMINHNPLWSFEETSVGAITIDADVPGTPLTIGGDEHDKAIMLKHPTAVDGAPQIGLTLQAASPVNLKGTSALSFWVKRNGGSAQPIVAVGFGDGTDNAVYYAGRDLDRPQVGENGRLWPRDNQWTQIIVPVPEIRENLTVQNLFVFTINIVANDEVYIDEIKFLKGDEVELSNIVLPPLGGHYEPGTKAIYDVIKAYQPDGYEFTYALKNDTSVKATLVSELSRPYGITNLADWFVWDNWINPAAYEFSVDNEKAAVSGNDLILTTPGTFNLSMKYGSVSSNPPMEITILSNDLKILENWENVTGLNLNSADVVRPQGYWKLFGWTDVPNDPGQAHGGNLYTSYKFKVTAAGTGQVGWNGQGDPLIAGRTFPEAQNLSGFDTISFWINPFGANNVGQRALEDETFTFTLYNGTTVPEEAQSCAAYYTAQIAGKGFSKTFTLATRGSTEEVTTYSIHWLEVRIPISELTGTGTLTLSAVTGWSIGIGPLTTDVDQTDWEYGISIDTMLAER